MIRTFQTHQIRKQEELTGCLWEFTPCQGEQAGQVYQVATPCCTESHPKFTDYRGESLYSRTFHAGGNIRLECKGVSHTATVYLDGEKIASHYNAYTSFDAVVRNLPEGEHLLQIKADNRFSEDSALHVPNDYMSYGGITRPVVLEQIENTYIKWIHCTTIQEPGDRWKVQVELLLHNTSDEEETLDVEAVTAGKMTAWQDVAVPAGEEKRVSAELIFTEEDGIKSWMPDHPKLYLVSGILSREGRKMDDLIDRFGFRQVTVQGKSILLNGEPLRIKGVCRHEDHPQFGCALPFAAMAADLELIQDLGANSVRTAHYPNDELFLDLCDEQGILVWEENHARGLSEEQMRNPNFERQAEDVIREMIPLHYNHPSIYIWGILNECASDVEYGMECYRRQFELIKQLDSSRPHSFASCKFKTDICFGLPDVVSYNIYPQWYHDTPVDEYVNDLYTWIQQETEGAGKPFLITEIGAGGLYGYRNPYHAKWTEEYQAQALEKQIRGVLEYDSCIGVYIWQFCDIRISEEWWGGRPRTMNNKGIVDEYRRRKLAYDVVKRLFAEL